MNKNKSKQLSFVVDLGSGDSGIKAKTLVSNLLTKRGFKNNSKNWYEFQKNFESGNWDISITSNINVRTTNGLILLKDVVETQDSKNRIRTRDSKLRILNHFFNINRITDKANLTRFLRKNVDNYKDFYPETYLNNQEFKDSFDREKNSEVDSDELWIFKPSNLRCGQDIYILEKSSIIDIIYNTSSKNNENFIIQKYISNPLLYKGRKFDVRVHCLLKNSEIYIHPLALMRLTSRPYTSKLTGNWDIDKFVHLTNHSIQKYDTENYGKYEESNVICLDSKDSSSPSLYDKFMPIWRDIIIDILSRFKPEFIPVKTENINQYELLGFDFIIDENYKTWLLEININPMLNWDHKEADSRVVEMMDDLFKIVIDDSKTKNLNSWVQI